jgi:hypothetical protein
LEKLQKVIQTNILAKADGKMEFFRFYNSLLNVWTNNFLANLCAAF